MSLFDLFSAPLASSPVECFALVNKPVESPNNFKHGYIRIRAMGENDIDWLDAKLKMLVTVRTKLV